jgi:hypothetical protein
MPIMLGWLSLTIFYNFVGFKDRFTTVLSAVIYFDVEFRKGYSRWLKLRIGDCGLVVD